MATVRDSYVSRMPPRNPWLADSVYPISHHNYAATDSVEHAGPATGYKLSLADVARVPALFTSNPTVKTVGSSTIIIAAGVDGIRKIDATDGAFDLISYLPYPGLEALAASATPSRVQAVLEEATAARRANDDGKLLALGKKLEELGFTRANLANGFYNLIDSDGSHYAAFGGLKIVKTSDDNDRNKPLRAVNLRDFSSALPAAVAKMSSIVGLGMTYDGYIAVAATCALFLIDRNLELKGTLVFPGEAIQNSVCIDDRGGIFVVTSKRMLKVVWTGSKLSYDEANGGWQAEYNTMSPGQATAAGAMSVGSGTTPILIGFGDDPDKLVVIADGDSNGTNLVAFWRDKIPEGFRRKAGTKSARIADQIRIDISRVTIETSPAVLGNSVIVLNTNYPKAVADVWGTAMTSGVTRAAPLGAQKFSWNTQTKSFDKAWVNTEVDNTDVMVPVISAKSGMVYIASKRDGNYEYVGVDWETGEVRARWPFPDDSRVWNAYGGITCLLENGDLLIGGFFAIKRVKLGNGSSNGGQR